MPEKPKPEAKPKPPKKKYTTPHVMEYGKLRDLTRGSGGMKGDFGNNMSRM